MSELLQVRFLNASLFDFVVVLNEICQFPYFDFSHKRVWVGNMVKTVVGRELLIFDT